MKEAVKTTAPAAKAPVDKRVKRDLRLYHLKRGLPKVVYSIFRAVFLICMAYVLLSPILIMLSRSLRTSADMLNPSIVWIPSTFTLENFGVAYELMDYGNTLLLTGRIVWVTTVLTLISCSMAGYALGRYNLKISKLCMVVAVLTIVVPIQTYIIPYFFQFRFFSFFGILNVVEWITGNSDVYLHLNNTELTYYLPAALGAGLRSGLFVIVFMQFFKGLPKELEDAARVDGCSEARTFIQVMLPNAGSAFLVVSLFSIVWYWNDYYFAQTMMQSQQLMSTKIGTIRTLVRNMSGSWGDGYSETVYVYAAALLFILPPLILYIIVQRFFIQSIERTGIVG